MTSTLTSRLELNSHKESHYSTYLTRKKRSYEEETYDLLTDNYRKNKRFITEIMAQQLSHLTLTKETKEKETLSNRKIIRISTPLRSTLLPNSTITTTKNKKNQDNVQGKDNEPIAMNWKRTYPITPQKYNDQRNGLSSNNNTTTTTTTYSSPTSTIFNSPLSQPPIFYALYTTNLVNSSSSSTTITPPSPVSEYDDVASSHKNSSSSFLTSETEKENIIANIYQSGNCCQNHQHKDSQVSSRVKNINEKILMIVKENKITNDSNNNEEMESLSSTEMILDKNRISDRMELPQKTTTSFTSSSDNQQKEKTDKDEDVENMNQNSMATDEDLENASMIVDSLKNH